MVDQPPTKNPESSSKQYCALMFRLVFSKLKYCREVKKEWTNTFWGLRPKPR